jgi:Fatty acid hydroxylase superfamily
MFPSPLHLLLSGLIAYVILSLLEHLTHRFLMHQQKVAKLTGNKYLYQTFRAHMAHHGPCYDVFNHEDRPCGLLNLTIRHRTELLAIALPAMMALYFDVTTTVVIITAALLHGVLWSAVHSEMHRPQKTWFAHTAIFQYLARYHFLHHRHTGTNFNTLFLGWDWLLGTAAKETEADRLEVENETWRVRPRRIGVTAA